MNAHTPIVPAYPPRYSYRHVAAFVASWLTDTVPLPGQGVPDMEIRGRRLVEACVTDRTHLAQLKAWAVSKANPRDRDLAFASLCRQRGWILRTAERNVELAITAVLQALLARPDGKP